MATTTAALGVGSGFEPLRAVLESMPVVAVRRIEVSGVLLDSGSRVYRAAGDVDLDVHLAEPDDAIVLAEHWNLHAYRARRSQPLVLDGEYLHQAWTGTLPTPAGPVRVRVSSCEYLLPPLAAITTTPHTPNPAASAVGAAA